ncbi:hypothetical protein [Paenibacillus crassostreae]|uniref:Uncharacterized protein n=1 Tax=Paenibacillus crassostreae TaxID=1763538 RepID=A0A167AUC6_9BACL|nr:hypothetical protein [Paenibacillus crassostreae]AOZ93611.1 hypothetical protein LPB68_16380 [Paenibacillus crassostreae]OAB71438.1 hypothetical protein PNBC_19250 [Paenibacillus crassostreae]
MSKVFTIKQNILKIISDAEPITTSFMNKSELLEIEFVKLYSSLPDFYRYSISSDNNLMAELNEGKQWWVIGSIDNTEGLLFPRFNPTK